MQNFDTARDALETSLNSSGSAMKEHEKWQQSLEAQINKLKASWQGLSQAFLSSDFLKFALDGITNLVGGVTKLIDTLGAVPTILAVFAGFKGITSWLPKILSVIGQTGGLSGIKGFEDALAAISLAFPDAAKGASSFVSALKGVKGAGAGATNVITKLLGALANPYVAIAAAAVTALTAAFVIQKKKAENLAKKVDELTDSYKAQNEELKKIKNNYDTSKESSMINKYAKLSKGVNALGENVSLTADEYSEYQSIVNQIAEQIPSLVSGYDSQGNAILSVKGNVEELVKAYEKLIETQNNKILSNAGDIEKDFANSVESAGNMSVSNDKLTTSDAKALKEMLDSDAESPEEVYEIINKNYALRQDIVNALEKAGIENDLNIFSSVSDYDAFIADSIKKYPSIINSIIGDFEAGLESEAEGMRSLAQAALSNALDLSDSEYYDMSDAAKNIAKQIVNGFDYGFFAGLQEKGIKVEDYINDLLSSLNNTDGVVNAQIDTAFNLQTKFNGGEISYGEYVDGLYNARSAIDKLVRDGKLDKEIAADIKLSMGLNESGIVEEYQTLINRLANSDEFNIGKYKDITDFINSLSAEDVSVLIDIIPKLSASEHKETIEEIKAAIEREKLIQGLTLDLDIKVETAGIEALNTALAESKSATGLTTESIDALKARYKDLDGYNVAALFEETANGIRVNSTELNKLEEEYKDFNKQKADKTLKTLKKEYDKLTDEIANCTDDQEKLNSLYLERDAILKQINDVATLAAQYEGLTSAYNEWQNALEAGQDRDMYESIISGREELRDEMSRGWLDDASVEYLELLTGKELSTAGIDAQIAAFKELDKTIGNSGYSIWDFFTEDEDGNSTSEGVFNFFDAVKSVAGETAAWVDENGAYNFDFEGFEYNGKTGDAAIAEILGTSEELVQIMLKAAEDAGFVVNIKGDYTDLANMSDDIHDLNERLKSIGATDYTFNIRATDLNYVNEQIAEAQSALQHFENRDGKINLDDSDVRAAASILATLIYRKSDLENPTLMSIDVSAPTTKLEEVLGLAQQLKDAYANFEVQTEIGADTTEAQAEIDSLLSQISSEGYANIVAGLSIDTSSVNSAIASINAISAEKMISLGLDTSKIDGYVPPDKEAEVKFVKDSTEVDEYDPQDLVRTVTFEKDSYEVDIYNPPNLTRTVTYEIVEKKVSEEDGEVSEANGTANVNGTAFANGTSKGRAFKQGDWGIKGSGVALGGELGTEILVRDGRWYTIGDNGAEFFNYRKGDIIFNHKQAEELFANGRVTSGGGRGKALADGTAFAIGSSAIGGIGIGELISILKPDLISKKENNSTSSSSSSSSDSSGGGGSRNKISSSLPDSFLKKETDKFEETIDFVEIAIERIERAIDSLDRTANNVYKSWSERNEALVGEITEVGDEIELQQSAYSRYMQEANSVGLSETWAERVRNGTIGIYDETDFDEATAEKIKEYQEWYEKALDCQDAIEELKEKEAELYAQRLEHVAAQYEGILGVIEHEKNMLEEYIAQSEAQGWLVSAKYYDALASNERENLLELEKQKTAMLTELEAAMNSGTIAEGSEAW